MASLHMARKMHYVSSRYSIRITCFNCILGRKEKNNNFVDKEKSDHIKREIDVPLELVMDDDDDKVEDRKPGRLSS